jgi:hypothetical protein
MVVDGKWVNRFMHPGNGEYKYHREYAPHLTNRLSEATTHDEGNPMRRVPGFELTQVTKKELFEARLKGT